MRFGWCDPVGVEGGEVHSSCFLLLWDFRFSSFICTFAFYILMF